MNVPPASEHFRARILHASPAPVLFLGAGASLTSGGRTAAQITDSLLLKMYPRTTSAEVASELFRQQYRVHSSFENVLDRLGSTPTLRRSLLLPFLVDMVPSQGYEDLALAVYFGYFQRVIVTTNFDTMMESALSSLLDKYGFDFEVRVAVDDEGFNTWESVLSDGEKVILIAKLHGCVQHPEHPLRTTISETGELSAAATEMVEGLFGQFGGVLIGYRLKDIGLRNSLQNVAASAGDLYIVAPDSTLDQDADVELLKERFGASARLDETFDCFAQEIGGGLREIAIRSQISENLDGAWDALRRATGFGSLRRDAVATSRCLLDRLASSTNLELQALREAVAYLEHPRGESFRLDYIITLLRRCTQIHRAYARVSGPRLIASLSLVLVDYLRDRYFLVAATEAERRVVAEEIVRTCEEVSHLVGIHTLTAARALVMRGEAEKEIAMVTAPLAEARGHFTRSRKTCEEALQLLFGLDDDESKYWKGVCLRHIAICYEQDANASPDESYREQRYRSWMDYSDQAVEILAELGEDSVRGYALMNRASAYLRLSTFELPIRQKSRMLIKGRGDLEKAISALSVTEDERGLTWAYVHLSENLRAQARLSGRAEALLRSQEQAAAAAVSHSRMTSDSLAIALAQREMGVASADMREFDGDVSRIVKRGRAEELLWKSAAALQDLGYYRGAGHAFAELSRLYQEEWQESRDISSLAQGLRACASAIASMGEAFADEAHLESAFIELKRWLDRFLDS